MDRSSRSARPPRLRTFARIPRGPRVVANLRSSPTFAGGPGDPPEGFLTGQNSYVEWLAYWALAKIFKDPENPRNPPFTGGELWDYQVPMGGAFLRALGSSVADFVVRMGSERVIIRIQTERYHLLVDSNRRAIDTFQRGQLEKRGDVVDVYDYELLGENDSDTAQKSVVTMKRAIGLIESADPLAAGTARRRRQ